MKDKDTCRICGERLPVDDPLAGVIFTGSDQTGTMRYAHSRCWDGFLDVLTTTSAWRLHELLEEQKAKGL